MMSFWPSEIEKSGWNIVSTEGSWTAADAQEVDQHLLTQSSCPSSPAIWMTHLEQRVVGELAGGDSWYRIYPAAEGTLSPILLM